jgi:hypothetical protein
MRERDIEKLIDDTMQSMDGAKRAEPVPFLFTRVMASVNNSSFVSNTWTKAAAFISKPGIAIAGLLLLMFLNIAIFFLSKNNTDATGLVQNNSIVKDEFATNAATIYDPENPEQ